MYILAFETSCDDTSVAVMRDQECIALSTRTQLEHSITGGVVPEVAARSHANAIFPCIDDALAAAGIQLADIDLFACTRQPGLAPSLLTGIVTAETLALSRQKPILWIDHIEAHIFANFLERDFSDIVFPSVVLTVSGGHTEIYLWRSLFEFELLGQTRDDAAGEAYDKVAKMMGMGFPGGAQIARLAESYRVAHVDSPFRSFFPRAFLEKDSLDFSFSGLKSAVKREVDMRGTLTDQDRAEIAYAFEEAVLDVLVTKLLRAQELSGVQTVCLAGGVSVNTELKKRFKEETEKIGIRFFAPTKNIYSQDNAAMVGIRAWYEYTYRTHPEPVKQERQ